MTKKEYLQKMVVERVQQNLLRESNTSADAATFAKLNLPLVKKIYPDMLASQICDVQPLHGPRGIISALFSYYKPTEDVNLENARIFEVDTTAGLVTGQIQVIGATTWQIEYIDGSGKAFLAIATVGPNAPVAPGTAFGAATVIITTINRASVKKIFRQYSGPYTNDIVVPRQIGHEIRTMTVEAKSRKLKSVISKEKVQDWERIYGEKAYDLIAENLGNEIIQELDMELIDYIRSIATPMPDVVLSNSYGTQGDMMAVGNDLYVNIFFAAEQIVKATKRNRTIFILADATTIGLLLTNPLHTTVSDDEDNPFYVGKLGTYKLYADIYSEDHYVAVGYRGENHGDGDTGIIYTPYMDYFHQSTDPETFAEKFLSMSRYTFTRHPQDQGTGLGDSDFFRSFAVDLSGLNNYTP